MCRGKIISVEFPDVGKTKHKKKIAKNIERNKSYFKKREINKQRPSPAFDQKKCRVVKKKELSFRRDCRKSGGKLFLEN